MATYSNNTTIKINTGITNTVTGTSGTLVSTLASNVYAIVQVSATGSVNLFVGSRQIATSVSVKENIYIGPGSDLTFTAGASVTVYVSGVSFINTP